MEILITNDDGWGSRGIRTLVRIMTQFGHVTVVAPDGPRSAQSSAITVGGPMTLRRLADDPQASRDVDIYLTNGTPADCVKLALNVLYKGDKQRVDFLVSGINHGSNASVNLIYSGTMGACFTAAEHGIPAIGFSINTHESDADFSFMEPYVAELTRHILDDYIPYGVCYNINAPVEPIRGIRWTRQCKGHWEREIEQRTDVAGNTAYWLVGEFVNHEPDADDTDQWAIDNAYISVQPCTIDMTAYKQL